MTAVSKVADPAARRFVQSLNDGDSVEEIYLVTDKQLRANRNGNLFLQLELRDRTGNINARLWNAGEPLFRSFDPGDFVLTRGKIQLFQGALQMILNHVERVEAEKIDLADFLPHTTQDVSKLYERLRTHLRKLSNPNIRTLAECFLMDEPLMRAFCKAPAGIRNHHAYIGGLLEHVVTMLDGADKLAPLYPELDRDLFLMGVFLHDIGKIVELTYERSFGYSDEGQLVGHLVIGVKLLAAKAAEAKTLLGRPIPHEILLRLEHIILSHHGTHEFGSPRLPMTPEAIAVHYLDNLDAKLHSFMRDIREDTSYTNWTAFNPSLDRKLFKGMRNKPADEDEDE
jgi:3'-5' exoribonuclease